MNIKATLLSMAVIACSLFSASAQTPKAEPQDPNPGDQSAWTAITKPVVGWGSIDKRYSRSQVATTVKPAILQSWKGERISAQAVVSTPKAIAAVKMEASDLKCGKSIIPAACISTYFETYTIAGHPGEEETTLVPDHLVPASQMAVAANTTRPMWIEIAVPSDAKAGLYKGTVTIDCDGAKTVLPYQVKVADHLLPDPSQWAFHLDLWQNPYSVARYFNVPLWSKEHFDVMRPIMTQYAKAGGKVITASIIQHPWNSQTYDPFESMVAKMKGIDGSWKYDYTVFDKWIEFMMSCGIKEQIDCYTLVPWQYEFDYYDCATNSVKKVDCKPQEQEYRDLILPFLKDFAAHLKQKGWFDITCIAMDERKVEEMNAALAVVKEADPGYRIAGSANYSIDSEDADKVYDMSVMYQFDKLSPEAIARRQGNGEKLTFYTCCSPARPNTFTFSDPAESAFLGWHAAAVGYDGYLRWALNSWPEDPDQDSRFGGWNSGDTYLLYPVGTSIRFERLVEGIQDCEKIRIVLKEGSDKQKAAMEEVLKLFAPGDYDESQDAADILAEGKKVLASF